MGEEGLDSAGLHEGINYLLLLLCVCWGACELAGRGAVSQKEEEAARSTYPALCFLRRHISTPKLIRGSGVTLGCTPEPPSGRKMPGRNHWSQVPLTGGENPRVAVPLRGRSHPGHQNIPQSTGSPFALERWRYPREEVAKGETGTALFDPRRCVRESWILFSPGWIHPSVLPTPSAPPRAVRAGPQRRF